MFTRSSVVALVACVSSMASAFIPSPFARNQRVTSSLSVAVDPEVVTKKEYEDICGINFDSESLDQRLQRTSFLYPKHVEVIEDFSPIVDQMVDEIVSFLRSGYFGVPHACCVLACFSPVNLESKIQLILTQFLLYSFLRPVKRHGNLRTTFLI